MTSSFARGAIAALVSLTLPLAASAQTGAAADKPTDPSSSAPAAQPWKYQTKRLVRAEVDALLAQPDKLLVLDIRRPDELIKYGSFPAFLNIQAADLENRLAYIPKDRTILTVSNHAQRAGRVGDLLASKGFTVAGATGSEDYENEGGKAVVKITAPPPRQAAASAPTTVR
ncbi:MAG: rhodanese-like domain-containing protein [Rubrivivax sp.]|nr:MAG: rhodanese-like domain-containing protein [Rubrivivax sp.]